jgi:hypothetical protein
MNKIVVIGAGPVGITCAMELAKRKFDVVLVESGGEKYDRQINGAGSFNQNNEETHAPMELAMRRQLGGASNIWGGRCVPYDSVDLIERSHVPFSKWPIVFDELKKYFNLTSEYFKCGDGIFSSNEYPINKSLVSGYVDGDLKLSDLEKWSLPTNFSKEYYNEIKMLKNVTILKDWTCVGIVRKNEDIKCIALKNKDGIIKEIVGDKFIFANGTVEATRNFLIFFSENNIVNKKLGKCYQGHLSGQISDIVFESNLNVKYDVFKNDECVYVRHRMTFSEEFQLRNKISNIAFWLVNPKIGDPVHGNGILSFAFLALASPLGRFFAPEAIRRAAIEGAPSQSLGRHVKNIFLNFFSVCYFILVFGFKRFIAKRKVPGFFQKSANNRYPLHYHSEQIPNPESTIELSEVPDFLGMPRVNVNLKFDPVDFDSVVRAHYLLDEKLREAKIGHLEFFKGDLVEMVRNQAYDGFHQVGTLRMADEVNNGVVDKNCKVFGFNNLYTVNGGVFPTSGQANTTYMAVLMGIRLADHLDAVR